MNTLPRNMKLQAFKPHRPHFTCKYEADVNPPLNAEADVLFKQGLAVTSLDLEREKRDYAKAAQLWKQAADMGHWKAALNLAGLYETGAGVPWDTEQAVLIVEEQMRQGVPSAFDKMGLYHLKGTGVKIDVDRAYAFWQLAADMGNAGAQAYIGKKIDGGYDNPAQGFWGNKPVARKMLECAFAQGSGEAAFDLAWNLKEEGGYGRALEVYHEGIKFGSADCALYLSVGFRRMEPLTGNLIDRDRAKRYGVLLDALGRNPDLRFPNLDKVLPLPPAQLPMWDGDVLTLINAAKALVPAAPVQPTSGAQRTGRAHIPQGWVLAHDPTDEVHPPASEVAPQDRSATVLPLIDPGTASFSGYWLPRLGTTVHPWQQQWNAAQVPQRYAQGEAFEALNRRAMGEHAPVATVRWHYLGQPVPAPAAPVHPRVAQGVARPTRVPEPPLLCRGQLACPRSGVWTPNLLDDAHPLARVFLDRWDRTAYVMEGQPFPDLRERYLAIAPHELRWRWIDNANRVGPGGLSYISLHDLSNWQEGVT